MIQADNQYLKVVVKKRKPLDVIDIDGLSEINKITGNVDEDGNGLNITGSILECVTDELKAEREIVREAQHGMCVIRRPRNQSAQRNAY